MALNLRLILHRVLEDYTLPWNGFHGVAHWARVLENGLRLAEETGAAIEVVQLFAVLHDCRRVNEHDDPEHGPRRRSWRGHFGVKYLQLRMSISACCIAHAPATRGSARIRTKRSRHAGMRTGSTWDGWG